MKTNKTLKNNLKEKIQARIQQIRASYPYSDLTKLPGLSVSQLAGTPNHNFKDSTTNDNNSMIITDLNKLALF